MKNVNNKKTILERGGLMIEALAMLGLIAVVTPTMYKKSAERTMEVEDINTATTMRTVMNAAEAYMSSNYADIMKVMEEDNSHHHTVGEGDNQQTIGVMDIPMADLAPYLPYKFNEDNALYNYNTPKIRIVRSGDNLTAFALFPAKVDGSEGIGQERTVRIASLIGANGGYVSESKTKARGVGGVWNLDGNYYSSVFDATDDEKQYSLVTSSSNVVNGSNAMAEADPTQFLQRTKQEGSSWRNAMRTDLYMGKDLDREQDPDDKTHINDMFSIRNINSLIVGTENEGSQSLKEAVRDTALNSYKVDDGYGLYVAGSGSSGSGAGNAYIKGTLIAAGNRFWADNNTLKYTGTNLEFDGTNFKIGKNQATAANDAANYVISGKAEKGNSQLAIMGTVKDGSGNMTGIVDIAEKGDIGNYKPKTNVQKKANVVINTTKKGTGEATVEAPKYSADDKAPEFGVDVSGNMVVEGVLAAGQLDVNKIRTSSLSVGSENVDDSYKWMDVDKDGVHVHQPNDNYTAAKPGTHVEVNKDVIAMRIGGNYEHKTDATVTANSAQIIMNDSGIIEKVADGKDLVLANNKVGVLMNDGKISIGNKNTVNKANITGTEEYQVVYGQGGDIDIERGNLKISDENDKPVFTVRGKGNMAGITDNTNNNEGNYYDIAGHGNTVFTDKGDSARFMALSNTMQTDAAVNVIRGSGDKSNEKSTGILYVDMEPKNAEAYYKKKGANKTEYVVNNDGNNGAGTGEERQLRGGAIYIRKGLIDMVPDTSYVGDTLYEGTGNNKIMNGFSHTAHSADVGRGVIRASRMVANNVDVNGDRVMVPDLLSETERTRYNGADHMNRYDTYMVNPAYTSVMNDIKLVSRGGARLSDVLPVFITKGIYTAVNNKSETTYEVAAGLESANVWIEKTGPKKGKLNIDQNKNTWDVREPASPIIGVVPAPQCPPGYARMITVTPASIRMSEAGRFKSPVASAFKGIQIDVDDFTNPTNSEVWEDAQGNKHPINDLSQISSDPSSPNYVPADKIDSLGQAMQLYAAYSSTYDSNGNPRVGELNPAYQEGVHLVGGNEKWTSGNPNGYDDKIEIDVTNRGEYALGRSTTDGVAIGDANDLYNTSLSHRKITSSQKRDGEGVTGTINEHKIEEKNSSADNVYAKQPAAVHTDEQYTYTKTANVISNDANSQVVTIHDKHMDGNHLKVDHTTYKLRHDIDISGTRIVADRIRNVELEDRKGASVYMLTAKNANSFEPITFQKSTWMKTAAIPLSQGKVDRSARSTAYATGWAILMGFIYPQHAYANVLAAVGAKNKYQTLPTFETATRKYSGGYDEQDTRKRYDGSDEYFFWNVFPVEQESLEAFVTTYCYFDQDNNAFGMFKNSGFDESTRKYETTPDVKAHLPMIDYIGTFTSDYKPEGENLRFRKNLNDPSMKYNELW